MEQESLNFDDLRMIIEHLGKVNDQIVRKKNQMNHLNSNAIVSNLLDTISTSQNPSLDVYIELLDQIESLANYRVHMLRQISLSLELFNEKIDPNSDNFNKIEQAIEELAKGELKNTLSQSLRSVYTIFHEGTYPSLNGTLNLEVNSILQSSMAITRLRQTLELIQANNGTIDQETKDQVIQIATDLFN